MLSRRPRVPTVRQAWVLAGILVLGLLVLRWPQGLEFRSDDYLAIQYVQDLNRVAHDFTGPQYDMQRLALFYRPLITLSIAIDARIGGNEAFVPLLMNLLVHLANAVLLFSLLKRYVGLMPALAATGWWAWHSGHLEAISWMVGRVDTHSTLFYLLAIELDLRHREGRLQSSWPALLAFVLGCMTKELALTLPGALFLLWLLEKPKGDFTGRMREAFSRLLPYCLVLLLVVLSRRIFLGEEIGGYAIASPQFANALGFWRPFVPRGEAAGLGAPGIAFLVLTVSAAVLFVRHAWRNWRVVPLLLALSIVLALPSAGARGRGAERYDYLPSTSMAGLLALGGPVPPLLMMGADLLTGVPERRELQTVSSEVRRYRDEARTRMQQAQDDVVCFVEAPLLIHGRVAFNVGTDRLGLAPFGHCPVPVLPLRAVDSSLAIQDRPPVIGTHLPDYEGPERLDLAMLGRIRNHEVRASLGLSGIRASRYAVLAAGSQGWLRVTVPADPRGRLDVEDLLLAPLVGSRNTLPLITHLWPSVETSADPRPVLYLEAYDDHGARIAASSRGIFLPLGRDIGKGLEAMRSGWWLSALLALLSLALLPVWRSRRSSPGSSDRARAPTGEAS